MRAGARFAKVRFTNPTAKTRMTTPDESAPAQAPITTTPAGIPVYCAHDELADPDTLAPHPKNPNRHPRAQIDAIVKVIRGTPKAKGNGWRNPAIISILSGRITRGHGRVLAAKAMGDKVPIQRQVYRDEAEEIADMLADNKLPELSFTDERAAIEAILAVGKEAIEVTGHTAADVEAMLKRTTEAPPAEVPFSPDLMLAHNYVVLYFDDPLDWQVAVEKFGLKDARSRDPNPECQKIGIGRVIPGKPVLEWAKPEGKP